MTSENSDEQRRLETKVVIITGGATGIGRACSMAYAKHGASVVIGDIDEENSDITLAAVVEFGGAGAFVPTDVSSSSDCDRLVQEAVDRFGRVDVLHANAGIGHSASLLDTTDDDWARVMGVNLSGAFYSARAAMEDMLRREAQGVITMTASPHAFMTSPEMGVYAASKGGMVALMRAFALEGGPHGIRCNAILPGATDTPMLTRGVGLSNEPEALAERLGLAQPMGRLGTPEDLAKVAVFLASDEAGFMTGSCVRVDGGLMAVINTAPDFPRAGD